MWQSHEAGIARDCRAATLLAMTCLVLPIIFNTVIASVARQSIK
jgi:hypothetical protein